MVLIECPNCRQSIQLVDLRPGRFVPKCPRCAADFELNVPEGSDSAPSVARLPEVRDAASKFVRVAVPEGPASGPTPANGSIVRESMRRVAEAVHRLWPSRLPRGIPRLADEGHLWILRPDAPGPYGPTFLAIPWCGGASRSAWFLPPEFGRDPFYGSRWVLEMIVAAELVHPNVDPYDAIGDSPGIFQSRNRAPGTAPGPLLAAKPIRAGMPASSLIAPADTNAIRQAKAAAIILQAARGLKAAHDQGVFHRDIRPENLVVDPLGTVRVTNFAIDPHAFLADAERQRELAIADRDKKEAKAGKAPLPPIDRRAAIDDDLVGLGRCWLALATDRPDSMTIPLEGLSTCIESVPASNRKLAQRLVSPTLSDRVADMGQVIAELEASLGVASPEAVSELESLDRLARQAGQQVGGASNLPLRTIVLRIAAIAWAVLFLLLFLGKVWNLVLNELLLGLMTIGWIGVLDGPSRRRQSGLFSLLLESMRETSLAVLAGCALGVSLLAVGGLLTGYLWTWIFLGILAFGLALAFEAGVGWKAGAEWDAILEPVERRVADLRISGLREEMLGEWRDAGRAIRSKSDAHRGLGTSFPGLGRVARSFLTSRSTAHRDRRHEGLLRRAEADRLVARGVNPLTAIRRARRSARAVITVIADARLGREWGAAATLSLRTEARKDLSEKVRQAIEDPEPLLVEHERLPNWFVRRTGSLIRTIFGRTVRVALGAAMLFLFAVWLDREGIVTLGHVQVAGEAASKAVGRAIDTGDVNELRGIRVPLPGDHRRLWDAWDEPLIHRDWSRALSGLNLGVAGLILVLSALSGRFLAGIFALAGAAMMLAGPVLTRAELGDSLARNSSAAWLIGGVVVAVLGLLIRPRTRRE